MSTKRPVPKGNTDLRQQKHIPAPPIEQIEKQHLNGNPYSRIILRLIDFTLRNREPQRPREASAPLRFPDF
jgi:hypothetical protein